MRSSAPSPASGRRRSGCRALTNSAGHLEKSAKADPAAAHGFAIERIVWKPLQETRDRDRALEPRQRHPGALMRAGAEGEMPVGGTSDVKAFRVSELGGVAIGG